MFYAQYYKLSELKKMYFQCKPIRGKSDENLEIIKMCPTP